MKLDPEVIKVVDTVLGQANYNIKRTDFAVLGKVDELIAKLKNELNTNPEVEVNLSEEEKPLVRIISNLLLNTLENGVQITIDDKYYTISEIKFLLNKLETLTEDKTLEPDPQSAVVNIEPVEVEAVPSEVVNTEIQDQLAEEIKQVENDEPKPLNDTLTTETL